MLITLCLALGNVMYVLFSNLYAVKEISGSIWHKYSVRCVVAILLLIHVCLALSCPASGPENRRSRLIM